MKAEYVSSTSFSVDTDKTEIFVRLRKVRLDCNTDGLQYGTVQSSQFNSSKTTIVIREPIVTENLKSVKYSIVKPGETGNEPPDWDQGSELPETGNDGDFFFKTTDGHMYIYNQ